MQTWNNIIIYIKVNSKNYSIIRLEPQMYRQNNIYLFVVQQTNWMKQQGNIFVHQT